MPVRCMIHSGADYRNYWNPYTDSMLRIVLFALLALCSSSFAAVERVLDAEQAIEEGAPLSDYTRFAGHPLYPYLQYRHYHNHPDTTSVRELVTFFQDNPRAPYSSWLAEQIFPIWRKNGNDQAIIDAYSPWFGDPGSECEWRLALLRLNQRARAEADIRRLWLSDADIEPACALLFTVMRTDGRLTNELISARFQQAMRTDHLALATALRAQLRGAPAQAAELWLAVRRKRMAPQALLASSPSTWRSAASADVLYWLSGENLDQAVAFALRADQLHVFFERPKEAGRALGRVASKLAQQDDPLCERIFRLIPKQIHNKNTVFDLIAYEQRMNRWGMIIELLSEQMSARQLDTAEYQYWLAKSYAHQGDSAAADLHYRRAAQKRDLFGFLAAEKLALPPSFNDRSLTRNQEVYEAIVNSPEAYRIRTFLSLDKPERAAAEFASLIRGLNHEQRDQAALFADQLGFSTKAITLLATSKRWDALRIRFPIRYREYIEDLARELDINPETIFAVIRKESIFQTKIRSHAGAIGLMQLRPTTARYIAQQYGIRYRGERSLQEPHINLQFGSRYLRDQLRAFGNIAYAAAAYNAGPNRVSEWLALSPDLPLDEWIAQIPFPETRNYVKQVLEYQKVYQYRMRLPYTPFNNGSSPPW